MSSRCPSSIKNLLLSVFLFGTREKPSMDKRIHAKKLGNLTYRHYLFHFKWPLLSIIFLISILTLYEMNLISIAFNFSEEKQIDVQFEAVVYPLVIRNERKRNTSILCYFPKKDKLKLIDDEEAIRQKQKVILPPVDNDSLHNVLKEYLILEYTLVLNKPRFCSHTAEEIFGKTCPYTNCKYTCDKTNEKDAHALLMHKRDLKNEELSLLKRNPEQIWLLWHDEANENSPEINKYQFNWTMSYRTSAEASLGAYGITILKQKSWSIEQINSWTKKEFDKRLNQAVWFVSNCQPKKRLAQFRVLREFYPVAAFGKCISPNQSLSLDAQTHAESAGCGRQSSCEKVHLSTSKFYLAFESQSCSGYVTEKFWRALTYGIIPVVSGPSRETYARIAPPNSFIHTDDFPLEEDLAKELKSIGSNRDKFNKYHAWRRDYNVYYDAKDVDPYRFCELCYRLNTNKERIWYTNINDWFLHQC